MRPITIIFGIFTVLLLSAFVPSNFSVPTSDALTENDKAGLIKLREEEKLAFEVYSFLDEMWDHHVFNNIKQSEARHGELLKGLLDQFSIKDPYIATKGQYANTQMQKLYQDLTTKGSKSLITASTIGPAGTSIIILRGVFSCCTISASEAAAFTCVPFVASDSNSLPFISSLS